MNRERLLELFLGEAREHLAAAMHRVQCLRDDPQDTGSLRDMMRRSHSLKGMAATMGFDPMVRVAHALEDLFDLLLEDPRRDCQSLLPLVSDGLGALADMVESVALDRPVPEGNSGELAARLRRVQRRPDAERGRRTACPTPSVPRASRDAAAQVQISSATEAERSWLVDIRLTDDDHSASRAVTLLRDLASRTRIERVDPPVLLDDPPRFSGKLHMTVVDARDRHALRTAIESLDSVVEVRLQEAPPRREVLREAKGPTTQWARVRADLLDRALDQVLDLLLEMRRSGLDDGGSDHGAFLLRRLYGTVMEMRLVPFASIAYRLNQTVRQLTERAGKRVDFRIEGGNLQLDRAVLDSLVDPLLHMVRNALDHGVEPVALRRRLGKPEAGSLDLRLDRRGERLIVSLEDDGRGADPESLRRAAVHRGLMTTAEARALSDDESLMLMTLPTFSTAAQVTETSGRGFGMDVVRQSIERLGGQLSIHSRAGHGTRFTASLPFNLALIQTMLVRAEGELYALPMASIERSLDASALAHDSAERVLPTTTLGGPPAADASALVLRTASGPVALVVDEVVGPKEVVVKPLEPPLDRSDRYTGAALLDDGSIALVVDANRLGSSAEVSLD